MQRDYQQLIRDFFQIYPDYSFCKSLVQNLEEGVCSFDHAEQVIYNKASGALQYQDAIEEKLRSKKIKVSGHWYLLKELSSEELGGLPDELFIQAVDFYLKNPYAHNRVKRPAWCRIAFVRNRFLRFLWSEAYRRKLDPQARDLQALIFLC